MKKIILISICFLLSSCVVNQGFPREVAGTLKPINIAVEKGEYDER